MSRIVLAPGQITSIADGDIHMLSAIDLARLYRVPLSRCVVYQKGLRPMPGAIICGPRVLGDYDHNAEQLLAALQEQEQ